MEKIPVIEIRGVSKYFDAQNPALNNVSLDIYNGEFLTILGPSGCGKTTLLRLIGGFEQLSHGEILMDNKIIHDLPANKRKINTVFQGYALFPHMSVFENVAFGLRMSSVALSEQKQRVKEVLEIVGMEGFSARYPHQLSGGQQQRVALARAVINRPRVLLLDEPFSALDAKLRKKMQQELKQLRRKLGITFIFVTHDQKEAFSMSDRVVIMNHGNIEQIGAPIEIYEEPANLYVATFVGETNIFEGIITETDHPRYVAIVEGQRCGLESKREIFKVDDKVKILLRPEDLYVVRKPEDDSDLWLKGVVEESIYQGSTYDLEIHLDCGTTVLCTEFFNEDADEMSFQKGETVYISWFDGWEVVLPFASDQFVEENK